MNRITFKYYIASSFLFKRIFALKNRGFIGLYKESLKRTILVFISLFFIANTSFSQALNPRTANYAKADSIALHLPKENTLDVAVLTRELTKELHSEHEKCRVIFRWITDNIAYSFSNQTRDVTLVLKRRKAVCMGYASLFETMCKKAGLECETVSGYAKTLTTDIGVKPQKTNHDWNVVKLYDKWYFIDATWAAGNYNNKFVKEFDDSYFLTDPKNLILSHFPQDEKYQYLDTAVTMESFLRFPIVYSGYMKNKLSFKTIPDGRLKREMNIQFSTSLPINSVYGMYDNEKHSTSIDYKSLNDTTYSIKYKIPSGNGDYTIFLNGKAVFGFKK